MLNPELKAKWLAALRSGKYKQGHKTLRNHDDGFCCLGVLCDVINPQGWNKDSEAYNWKEFEDSEHNSHEEINPIVGEKLGIEDQKPLIDKNDGKYKENILIEPSLSFPEIADYIEENL